MHKEFVDCVVIGAGVVGLSIARALSIAGREVILLDCEKTFGTGISSRNSEVIHAGIYYPKGSLKARFCTHGKELLYKYASEHNIPHKQCGKIIVATNYMQDNLLSNIQCKASDNGVTDLKHLSKNDAVSLEPALHCKSALLSPSTGIIDTHSFMLSLLGDFENHGGISSFSSEVIDGNIKENIIELIINAGDEIIALSAKSVINSAGFGAIPMIKKFGNFPTHKIPHSYYAKGNYFSLDTKNPFSHLIYPVPEQAGLGIHLTIDLSGKARFGPDVEWINNPQYDVNKSRVEQFYPAIRNYWPSLPDNSLSPDYAGVRPKIQSQGEAARDFIIQGPDEHGISGLINLFGIESPGLTSSLAIAEYVKEMLVR